MNMATQNASTGSRSTISAISAIKAGAVAGLGGGAVFGMLMAMMGTLPMVAMLAGSESATIGFLLHMIISAAFGAVYGFVAARLPRTAGAAVVAGTANGMVWWVLDALILMPLMLGMPQMVFQIEQTQWFSLMGHVIYGVVTALLFIPLSKRL